MRNLLYRWGPVGGLVLSAACAPETPFYDDEIGVAGVATEPGALAGTFAQKVLAATLVQVPLLPDQLGGGVQWLLIERSDFDAETGSYAQTSRICDGMNFEVHGTAADVPRSTYRLVPPSTAERFVVDAETGEQMAEGLVQLWGIRDLANPADDPFPTTLEEADSAAFAAKIYDMDDDGQRGYTTEVTGIASGEAYGILRRKTTYRGVVTSPDRIVGLADTVYDSFVFGASNDAVSSLMGSTAPTYPDPKESWFEELRLPADADCDDVVALEESGTFSRLTPF